MSQNAYPAGSLRLLNEIIYRMNQAQQTWDDAGQLTDRANQYLRHKFFSRLPRFFSEPRVQLVLLGIFSWLFYFHLTDRYPLVALVAKKYFGDFGRLNGYVPSAMYDYLFSLAAPMLAYWLAYRIVKSRADSRWMLGIIIGFAALFAGTLVIMYPIGATDMYDYVFYSRIWVHYNQNPLVIPPMQFSNDPFFRTVIWYKTPSPYGPLWLILSAPGSWIAGDDMTLNLLMMHALPSLFFLASALVIAQILKASDPAHRLAGTLLFAWNPLVLFEGPGNGHNGIIMMFFVLLAIYFVVRRRWEWVLPALVASVLVKYISAILILPFLIFCWRAYPTLPEKIRYFARTSGISLVLAGIVFAPFLSLPTGLLDEANWYSLLAIPTFAFHVLDYWFEERDLKTWVVLASGGLYLLLYFYSLKRIPTEQKPRRLVLLCTWLTVAYLAIACVYFQPWFIKWLVALGIWANHALVRRVILTFTVSGLASYAVSFYWVWNWTVWDKATASFVFIAVIFGPPLLVGAVSLLWRQLPSWRARLIAQAQALSQA